ncbi:MAG TPA: vitamin B12-dependent ribonucleotide reductase, partial [Candidatus Polarisedimenticolia bacterium]|nr:vitamin B12-dependent ribonucleotide reductase [Candidatus Polarisedimenticolia bacterium]
MKKESELRERGAEKTSRENRKTQVRASSGYAGPLTLRKAAEGLTLERYFTRPGVDPFDEVEWEIRPAVIGSEKGEIVFEQKDVEVPKFWSQTATNVVASKYFRGTLGTPERERSVKQLIGRVVRTIGVWGRAQGYFGTEADAQTFEAELKHLLVYQKMSFNSPVWFNVGVEMPHPQASACFINSVEDTMDSILTLAKTEGMLFKYGSGTGSNLSPIRSSKELLAGGGTASGPVSFMKGYDAFAGVIKSGGKTRRAAKMVILNIDHPDIVEFIKCKQEEEKKAWALIDAGYSSALDGPAYGSVFFQNSNNSVRVTDDFMKAIETDADWWTRRVTNGEPFESFKARDLMKMMAEATWQCGDPGMQFDTTINDWHPVPNSGRINASNPCSEFMHLDDTACNLASLNLMKLANDQGELDVTAYKKAIETTILAQEILVDNASYPTQKIADNSHNFRPLGLGYANVGALLMSRGLAYDSDAGRDYAAAITAVLTGQAYVESARIAGIMGPFNGYEKNREPFLKVIKKHGSHVAKIDPAHVPLDLYNAARECWDEAYELGARNGIRNAQATVIAPTGTIAFMMDCDTTGIEPDIALIKYKKLVGGGMLKIVNQTVPKALKRLGYSDLQVKEIMEYVDENETIEGAPHLKDNHLSVFDCAFRPLRGSRSIQYMGHVKMMGAVQPFISGAISKTVNVPNDTIAEEIMDAYIQAWHLGVKALAIYRDGSKTAQALRTDAQQATPAPGTAEFDAAVRAAVAKAVAERGPQRNRMPRERQS